MREVWETPYGNAALKIEWADKHIADVEQRLSVSEYAYEASVHLQADTGKQFLYYALGDKYIRAYLALMIGDAIHNLKCALDITWLETVSRLGIGRPGYSKFPVYSTREALKSALTDKREIPYNSALFKFMVDSVKSYERGNPDIWAIHRLDIHDKHHLLIPVLNVLSIDGVELEQEDGKVDVLTLALTGPIPNRIEIPFGSKLKNHGHAAFQVKFREGIPAEGLEVVPTLHRFSYAVTHVVRHLDRIGR